MATITIKLGMKVQPYQIKIGFVRRHFIKQMFLCGIELVRLSEHFSLDSLVTRKEQPRISTPKNIDIFDLILASDDDQSST